MVKCPHAASGCNYPEGDCPGHCSVNNGLRQQQPEALRLAKILEDHYFYSDTNEAAAELRRLHTENEVIRHNSGRVGRRLERTSDALMEARAQRDELLEAMKRIAVAAEATVCNVKWVARHCRSVIDKAGGAA